MLRVAERRTPSGIGIDCCTMRTEYRSVGEDFGAGSAQRLEENASVARMASSVGTAALGCPAERSSATAGDEELGNMSAANHNRRERDGAETLESCSLSLALTVHAYLLIVANQPWLTIYEHH